MYTPEAARVRRILALALPIMGAMVSQSVLNLVDTAMVGTLGDAPLAAVGLGGFVNSLCLALILGVSAGVQTMAARRKGEGNEERSALPLNAALLMVVAITPPLSVALFVAAPYCFHFLNSDPAVIQEVVPYFQVRIAAAVFIAINYSFRGFWNGVDLSRLYMTTLVVMHSANVFLNWVFIFGNLGAPAMGTAGAGLASALSVVIGSALYLALALRFAREQGFLRGLPPGKDIVTLVRLSVPNGLQQMSFIGAFTALYWIIGQVGTAELAAANVLVNLMLVAVLPGFGLGLAAATLVSQAMGRNDTEDANRWTWETAAVSGIVMFLLGLPLWLFPDLILAGFLHDPATVDLARWPMRIVGIGVTWEGVRTVLMHALIGAGDVQRVMRVSVVTQWLLGVALAYIIGPLLGYGLLAIWLSQELYRGAQLAVFWRDWRSRRWAAIQV